MSPARLPALLCDGTFYGTLAAVRSLGRSGVPVYVADERRMTAATWSRYATRSLRSPPVCRASAMLRWLREVGAREGRLVLYPTSDEMAFLLSAHRDELSQAYALYQPDLDTVLRILDKRRLHDSAREAGVDVPETFFPETRAEAERIGRAATIPLLFKPRTQLFLEIHRKGAIVQGAANLGDAYEAFRRDNHYLPPIVDRHPELTQPMLQRYYPEAADGIYSLSGFRSRGGKHLRMLGAVKVLQRPRKLGIGLCFEGAPVPDDLRAKAVRLLETVDHFGVFELEFIRVGGRYLLIDMNPRFYNQLQLDVSRGLDLPRLAYAAASGDEDEVARLSTPPREEEDGHAFCNGLGLRILVGAQRVFGTMSEADAERWRAWRRDHGARLVDSIASPDDVGPLVADGVGQIYYLVRHPRAFLRTIALDR